MQATWLTLKTHARDVTEQDPATRKLSARRVYDQDGQVCQAEEIQVAGQWRRFYGFVGRYDLAPVPAEEIEFPAERDRQWKQLPNGIDCRLIEPGTSRNDDAGTITFTFFGVGDPLKTLLSLHNRRGVPIDLPAQWYQPAAPGGPALHPGVELRLAYSDKTPDDELMTRPELLPDADWQEVPARPRGRWVGPADPPQRALEAGASFNACEFDLASLFQITKPGTYRMLVEFHEKAGSIADGASAPVTFQLAPPRPKP